MSLITELFSVRQNVFFAALINKVFATKHDNLCKNFAAAQNHSSNNESSRHYNLHLKVGSLTV